MEGIEYGAVILDPTLSVAVLAVLLLVAMGVLLFGYVADEEARGRRIEWLEEPLAMPGEPRQAEEVRIRKAA